MAIIFLLLCSQKFCKRTNHAAAARNERINYSIIQYIYKISSVTVVNIVTGPLCVVGRGFIFSRAPCTQRDKQQQQQ